MRIVHIVGILSPDGSYGGPSTVALNQTRALLELGHEVTLAAGALGFGGQLPMSFDGVPVTLFRATSLSPRSGFATMIAPGLNRWIASRLRDGAKSVDAVHVHLARDLITLPAALQTARQRRRLFVQPHGMIGHSKNLLATPLDALATRRVLRSAERVFHLTAEERLNLESVARAPLNLTHLTNGITNTAATGVDPKTVEVLFLARIHERKRPLVFVEAAKKLHSRFPSVQFRMVGPDEGLGHALREAIDSSGMGSQLSWEGPVDPRKIADRFKRASIYVLPAINEPFGMTVLEAMAQAKPVVVTDSCGLAEDIRHSQAGLVAAPDSESLATAISTLLSDRELRSSMGLNAQALATQKYSMSRVTATLTQAYSNH